MMRRAVPCLFSLPPDGTSQVRRLRLAHAQQTSTGVMLLAYHHSRHSTRGRAS